MDYIFPTGGEFMYKIADGEELYLINKNKGGERYVLHSKIKDFNTLDYMNISLHRNDVNIETVDLNGIYIDKELKSIPPSVLFDTELDEDDEIVYMDSDINIKTLKYNEHIPI